MDIAQAFAQQNPHCMTELNLEEIQPFFAYHAGGLLTLASPVASGGNWTKMHDSWGPGAPEEPGSIVVHAYNPKAENEGDPIEFVNADGIPQQVWSDGTVWFFNSGRQALEFFLKRIP